MEIFLSGGLRYLRYLHYREGMPVGFWMDPDLRKCRASRCSWTLLVIRHYPTALDANHDPSQPYLPRENPPQRMKDSLWCVLEVDPEA